MKKGTVAPRHRSKEAHTCRSIEIKTQSCTTANTHRGTEIENHGKRE